MPLQPVHAPPPLLPPLALRVESGFFGAPRDGSSPTSATVPLHGAVRGNVTIDHHSLAAGLIALFTRALELGRPVAVRYRDSVFLGGNRGPAGVALA